MLPLSAALPVDLAARIVNQAIGFGVLGYPMEMNTLFWGLAIGVAALAATNGIGAGAAAPAGRGPRCDAHARGDRRLRCVRNRVACFRPGLGRLRGLHDDDHRTAWAVKCPLDAGLGRGLRNRSTADCGNTAPSHLERLASVWPDFRVQSWARVRRSPVSFRYGRASIVRSSKKRMAIGRPAPPQSGLVSEAFVNFSCALCRIEAVRRPPTIPATKNSRAHSDPFVRVVAQFLRIVACPFRNPRQRVRLPVRAAQSPQIDAIDAPSDDHSIGGA